MSSDVSEASPLPLAEQIEQRPTEGAFYFDNSLPFGLRRWTPQHGWQMSAGWIPADPPRFSEVRRLVTGPELRAVTEEPKQLGAVVVEHLTDEMFVLVAGHRWVGPSGDKSWSEISYPLIKHYGAHSTSAAAVPSRGGTNQ